MADKEGAFVDHTENFIVSPQKEKISKNKTTVLLAEDTKHSSSETSSKSSSPRRRVSSTSWQITKTSEITDEVNTGQKVTTMSFEVDESGSISPGVESEKHSFVSSTKFAVGLQKESEGRVFGISGSENNDDPSDEFVMIENEDLAFVDRTEITEVHEEQESVAPEAKKSYFAYLLDQNQASGSAKATAPNPEKTSGNEAGLDVTSANVEQKTKDDAALYERITFTPGLACRSYAVEEMKEKKTSGHSPERTYEDAKNNNMDAGATAQTGTPERKASSENQGLLSPSEGYRISQIIAVQETELWEEERLKKEREEYSIIDSLSMDDMMKMLGEHDRMKFEAQVANEEIFPVVTGPSLDNKYSEKADSKYTERSEQSDISSHVTSVKREQRNGNKYSETSQGKKKKSTDSKTSEMVEKGRGESEWSSPEVKYSETVSQTMVGPNLGTETNDTKYSEMSQRVEQIKISTSSVEQISTESHVSDSPSVTTGIMDNRQTETAILSQDQSSKTGTQELKTQIKSFDDAEQSISMGIRSEQSATSLEGGVAIITAERQSVVSQSHVKDKPILQPVEVERKFNITADTENKIKNLGGKLVKEKTLVDIYYDNSDYTLTLSDCWLRKRNNKWEMKVAAEGMSVQDFATQYKEITKEGDIMKFLKNILKFSTKSSKFNEILKTAELSEFATIATTRKSYQLAECTVDLDLTDHGFQVGEIEVMASSAAEIPAALKTIDGVAKKLGLDMKKKIYGKMTDYLRRNNLSLYRLLVDRHVLVPVVAETEMEDTGIT